MDTVTPLKIALFSNLMNAILDPIFIFTLNMGVTGAALATLAAEIASAVIFTIMLTRRKMILPSKMFRVPEWAKLGPLLKGGAALQLRNFALNITFLAVTRVTQSIDDTGVAAAAHAMAIQTFQIGGIVLLALSTVAQIVVPNAMIEKIDEKTGKKSGGFIAAKDTTSRLMRWGLILGLGLGSLQTALIPQLQKSTPIVAVREAARVPALLASLYQVINGLVFIGEGVMVGTGSFLQLSLSTLVATIGTVLALQKLPAAYGLTGVWMSFGVFNTFRLIGVFIHQKINGPLTNRKMKKMIANTTN
jgi:Na+-driven multidrug efflux pump